MTCARFSPNGDKAATVGLDKKGIIWDGKTGYGTLPASPPFPHWAGRGDDLMLISHEHAATSWWSSPDTPWACTQSWSPDSQQLITASADKTVKLWTSPAESASRACPPPPSLPPDPGSLRMLNLEFCSSPSAQYVRPVVRQRQRGLPAARLPVAQGLPGERGPQRRHLLLDRDHPNEPRAIIKVLTHSSPATQ